MKSSVKLLNKKYEYSFKKLIKYKEIHKVCIVVPHVLLKFESKSNEVDYFAENISFLHTNRINPTSGREDLL